MSEIAPNIAVILLAGGSGSRMNGTVADKILLDLNGKPVFLHSFQAFWESSIVSQFVIVHRDEQQKSELSKSLKDLKVTPTWTIGGTERHHSVFNGLNACKNNTDIVLIHDCARPLITVKAIRSVAQKAQKHGSACLAKKISDTIKTVTPNIHSPDTYSLQSLDRSKLWAMETPQAFRFPLINEAYNKIIQQKRHITDDLSAIEDQAIPTMFVENDRPNQKLTTPNDIHFLEFILSQENNNQRNKL